MGIAEGPLISVVIPTYKRVDYLGRAIESVINQDYDNWELIIVDNYSEDGTENLVSSFNDPRIHYLNIYSGGVIAKTRNAGINKAMGDWVAFLDSDDWWARNKLRICSDSISNNVDFIYHDLMRTSISNGLFKKIPKGNSWQVKSPVIVDLLLKGNSIDNSSVVVRRNLLIKIGGIDERREIISVEDYHAWMKIAKLTNQILYLPKKLGWYQIHDNNISCKDMSDSIRFAVTDFIDFLNERQRSFIEARIRYTKVKFNYLAGERKEVTSDLLFCIRHAHISFKIKSIALLLLLYKDKLCSPLR